MSERTVGSVGAWASGRWSVSPKWAASSRATPTMHMASGRFGVIDKSKITSSSPRSSRTSVPGFVDSSRWTIPSWSSPRPSSSGASSVPSEVTPRIFLRSSTPNGSGRCAPAGAYGTRSPAATFSAPHTTRLESLPKSTSTRVSLSAFGCFTTSSTRAAITPRTSRPGSSTPSTSRPTWLSPATSSSVEASTGVNSRIQDSGARISASVLSEEANVGVEERADLVAVRAPGGDDVDGRFVRFHGPDLHRGGVGSQHHLLVATQPHVQRVLHGTRRMRRRDVERLEVVPVVLDLRPFGDAVSQPGEDVLKLALNLRDEMQMPSGTAVPAGGQVEALAPGAAGCFARGGCFTAARDALDG